ncbi:hypothetical protein [Sphingomonas immobilis]|uniref:Uncharacterized protein n=1 Tax=Sphingomonas immobilis TaxID=3063997 RepID=A0ABT8ZYI7_9SPHN|nr:hypothetical protein [Sphingomonas sp. CA1-15]MDO7842634.1 hypothetical protein [Sphingomonas sp. CA1-15]
MPPYLLSPAEDRGDGVIVLEVQRAIRDSEVPRLIADLTAAMVAARRNGDPYRLIFDDRLEARFSEKARRDLIDAMAAIRQPGDRTAMLVTNSMMKLRLKADMSSQGQAFISELAALTWLNAWTEHSGQQILTAAK